MKYQIKARIRQLLLLPLVAIFAFAGSLAHASVASVTCTGLNTDNLECSLNGIASEGLLNLMQDVLEFAENAEGVSDACFREINENQTSNSFTCELPGPNPETPLTFQCTEDGANSTCTLEGPDSGGLLSLALTCSAEDGTGTCEIESDQAAARNVLIAAGITGNEASLGLTLLDGCVLAGVGASPESTAFQQDCQRILSLANNPEQLREVLQEITPHNVDVAIDTTAQLMNQQFEGVAGRLSRLRQNQRGMDVAGLRFFDGLHWVDAGSLMASNEPVNADAPSVVAFGDSRLGVFVDGALLSGSQDADSVGVEGETEYDGQTFTLGIDYRITDALIAGMAYSLGVSSTDFSGDRGSLDTTNYTLIGYGTYYRDAWYVEGTLAAGSDRFEQDRRMRCDMDTCGMDFDVLATSEYYGDQTAFSVATGYAFTFDALTLTPNLQWSQMTIDTDAYQETTESALTEPGTGFLLAMEDQSRDHNTISAGVDASYAISTSFGVVQPHASIDLRNELDDEALVVNGQFLGATANDADFALTTRELDSSYYVIGVGSSLQLSGGSSGFIDVRSLLGYEDASQWQFRAGWRWEM